MPFQKGSSWNGNAHGRAVEKPFADALRLELAAAGSDHRALRAIARNMIRIASMRSGGQALPAIMALADRLDGRPSQESMVTVTKRDASDWTRDELVQFLQDARRQVEGDEAKLIEAKPVKDKSSE
jgi:hypothetical protein